MRLDVPLMLGGLGLALALAIFVPDFRSLCPAGHESQGWRCVPALHAPGQVSQDRSEPASSAQSVGHAP